MAAVVALVLAGLVGLVGSANAAPSASFAAQARAQGLSATQELRLQERVDAYLTSLGGTQIAPNEIAFNGATLLVTVPGEQHARDLSSPTSAAVTCPSGAFCGWEFDNFTGDTFTQFACGVKVTKVSHWWTATGGSLQGSYFNNQTGHAVARFYNSNNNEVRPSSTAVQKVSTFAWGSSIASVRVSYVIVC
ncbi:MAG TPA: hypothetical protein VFX16_21020 [Pseudonocardiaceae bacterium]|nr:hypothetical protein [Pseudonocardiaceae bacterium]